MQDWVRERLIKFLGDDVMKKMTKAMLMTALILGSVSMGTAVEANELNTFALDEYVVTATYLEYNQTLLTNITIDVQLRNSTINVTANNQSRFSKDFGITYI